ncbi:MAG: cytochrome C oxidase subunit II [Casimicrobiaceae bacterium]
MSASSVTPSPAPHAEAVAEAAERRWAIIVGIIIALLVAVMIATGVQWAAMPPSRVETIDSKTLHIAGEFVESNLGTTLGADGKVTVRIVAQQYSFIPQCIVVPSEMPVTFRGTSADAIHGFIVGRSNANTMLVPGFVATFTTRFQKTGESLMPCHEYCGTGHEAMWARVQVLPPNEFLARARGAERLNCDSR